jgi:hypothetical protein
MLPLYLILVGITSDRFGEKRSRSLVKNTGGRRIFAFLQADSGRLVLLALLWYLNL